MKGLGCKWVAYKIANVVDNVRKDTNTGINPLLMTRLGRMQCQNHSALNLKNPRYLG